LFNWLKRQTNQRPASIRDTLFGDMPLDQWPQPSSAEAERQEPWASFARARERLDSGDKQGATTIFQGILGMPLLESRQYLQAWHFLCDLGVFPPKDKAKEVLGVVVEVGMDRGLDLVAAYPDHHARYYNFSGAGVAWERPNDSFDKLIDDMLRAATNAAKAIGRWEKDRPSPPAKGQARVNILTPSGLHFGQGPLNAISKDAIGGPVIAVAFQLMQSLIKLTAKPATTDAK
jgi:hypothetical protein